MNNSDRKMIYPDSGRLYSSDGREFIPRGINMVCKDKSKHYIGSYTGKDFSYLKDHGFNLIRLGIFWDAVEPEPGCYDDGYLDQVGKIIDLAASANIPVFLDMHQDLFGIVFEDGAPEWATLTDGEQHIRTELWSESYLASPAVQHAFDNFWNNSPASDGIGIRSRFINMWKHVAARFADNPYVIGYDVLNEPFPGSDGARVAAALNGFAEQGGSLEGELDESAVLGLISKIVPITSAFEEKVLSPFYDELFTAIRNIDPRTLLFLESNYFANAGIPSFVRPAQTPSGGIIPGQVYAPHGYDILVDTADYSQGGTERIDLIFGSLLQKIEEMAEEGVPSLIGEWGCYPNASDAQLDQARHILSMLSEYHIGNVYFEYSHLSDGRIITVL